MRIAIDCRSVYPGRGGIGRYTEGLVRALAEIDGENEYVLFRCNAASDPVVDRPNVTVLTFDTAMIDPTWEQLALPSELDRLRADVYHATCFTLPVARAWRGAVVTIHDVVFRRHPELVEPGLRAYLSEWSEFAARTADRVTTVSEHARGEIAEVLAVDPDRIRVIPPGVDDRFRPMPPDEARRSVSRDLRLPDRYVLFVGALEAKKGVPHLIEAFAAVAESPGLTDLRLVLAGGRGPAPLDVEGLVDRWGLTERVVLPGYVADEDLPGLYAAAEAFVYPSLYEGFGLPVLEALASGVPVIAGDRSSLPEVCGAAAVLVDPEDPSALAEALKTVLTDDDRRQALAKAGPTQAGQFTWRRMAEAMLDLYREVAG